MADPTTRRRTPLAGHAATLADVTARSGGWLRLAELPPRTQLSLRLDPASPARQVIEATLGLALPLQPNTTTCSGQLRVVWLGPDEWLLLAPATDLATGLAGAAPSLVDVSAAGTIVEVSGRAARTVLAHGCVLDLHPRVFPTGRCAQTRLALAGVVLLAIDAHPLEPTFWVLVRSSYAGYLADWLADAAVEYLHGERAREAIM